MFSTHVEGSNWRGCVSRCKNLAAACVSNGNDSGQDKWAGGKWCTAAILCYLFTPGCENKWLAQSIVNYALSGLINKLPMLGEYCW